MPCPSQKAASIAVRLPLRGELCRKPSAWLESLKHRCCLTALGLSVPEDDCKAEKGLSRGNVQVRSKAYRDMHSSHIKTMSRNIQGRF